MSEHKIRELTALYEVARLAAASLDLDATLTAVLRALAEHLEMERGTLTLLDTATGHLAVRASHGLTRSEMRRGLYKVGEGITGRVFASGAPFVVPDIGKEPLFLNRTGSRRDLAKENISFIGVPVAVRGKTIGVLTVDKLFAREVDFEEDIRLLKTVASIVGQAVKLHEMVEAEKAALVEENQLLREEVGKRVSLPNIVGGTKRMQEVFRAAEVVAKSRATVLLRGESGTGKELVAKAVHHLSPRGGGPYVRFNCAAVPEGLLESELFGHEKGAFTGAIGAKKGRFELADGGTIFLDEIGDLPLPLQPKILRVLQEQEFERLGSERTVRVDVRVIAATSRDLERLLAAGQFREDLYYRLNVVPIFIPPLRERREDVPALVDHFARRFGEEAGRAVRFTPAAVAALAAHEWPGNVRELENTIERTVVLSARSLIDAADLKLLATGAPAATATTTGGDAGLPGTVHDIELRMLREALEATRWRQAAAARRLGITPRQIGYRIRKYGLLGPS
ncbi:MAG TPA: nif-specific transcriptional activator NifA [bacterium]